MTNLLIPKHIAVAERVRRSSINLNSVVSKVPTLEDEIAAPIPEGVPPATWYRVVVMPIGMRTVTRGGLHLTPGTEAAQTWNHGLAKVVSIGSTAFQSSHFDNVDRNEIPKVGSLVLVNPKTPARVIRNGVLYFIFNDDQILSVVQPEHASGYSFVDGIEL